MTTTTTTTKEALTMANLPAYFFIGIEGNLYDTRHSNWSSTPLRVPYSRHFQEINTCAQLKACLRAGGTTGIGGYALAFLTSDGDTLSFDAVRDNLASAFDSIRTDCRDDWRVVGLICEAESDEECFCSHTGSRIWEAKN